MELAGRQHGAVSLDQLRALGLSASAVRSRVSRRRLHPVHRGVLAVGRPDLTRLGRWMAAALAYRPDGVVSHRDGAALLGLRRDSRAEVDVTVPRRARPRAGVTVHVTGTLRPVDVSRVDGIPCTSAARTLVDLGDVLGRREVERAVEQAEILRMFDLGEIEDVLGRAGQRRGSRVLREVVGAPEPTGLTASELEERFLEVVAQFGIPRPAVNQWIALDGEEMQVDFLWREQRLVVETDGHRTHGTRQAFERDRRRDQRLSVAGYRVVRLTWRQLVGERAEAARTIAALLAR